MSDARRMDVESFKGGAILIKNGDTKKLDLCGRFSREIHYEDDDPPSLVFLLDKNPYFRGLTTADEIWQIFDGKRVRMRIEVLE